MPRKPRVLIDGMAVHIVQRGVDRAATFFTAEDQPIPKGVRPLYGINVTRRKKIAVRPSFQLIKRI